MKMQGYKPLVPLLIQHCPVQSDLQMREAWLVRGWVVTQLVYQGKTTGASFEVEKGLIPKMKS